MLKISNKIFKRLFSVNTELLVCNDLMDFISLDMQYYSETPSCMTHKNVNRRFSSEMLMTMVLRNCCRVGSVCSLFRPLK